MSERYDVIVVGTGPAGAAAAAALARAGVRVLALDRARFPRDKACGDTLTPKAFPALERLGVLAEVLAAGHSATHYVWRSPGGREQRLALPPTTHVDARRGLPLSLPRPQLDTIVRTAAARAGANVREGHRVRGLLRSPDGRVCGVVGERWPRRTRFEAHADVVIAADGALSSLVHLATGAQLPRPAWGARVRLEGVASPPEGLVFRFDRRLAPGYAWLFPLPGGGLNAGLGAPAARVRRTPGGLRGLFDAVLGEELRTRFPEAHVAAPLWGAPVASEPPTRPLPPGLLAVGDAAGLTDAFSGEGLPAAYESGLAAADAVITRGPERWVALASDYGGAARRIGADRRLSRALQSFASQTWLLERAMDVARLRPGLARYGVATLARGRIRDLFAAGAVRALLQRS